MPMTHARFSKVRMLFISLKPIYFNDGARLLLDLAGGLILSSDNPLDLHAEI